ncbi:MAG: nucleotidyltransferase family protein [Geobacteraceae bacterium]|nr:nucleotidyltransferase family protein [Geobacteraceae bacterium]
MSAPVRPGFAPPPELELLLQAILAPPATARESFAAWCAAMEFNVLPYAHFRLLGELAGVIDQLAPDYQHRTRVLGIQKYIWSNNIHILRTALPALDTLNAAALPFAVLKGGGVIAANPVALQRRFIRDLDLLVATADVPRAAALLMEAGWRPVSGRIPGRIRAQSFDHSAPANAHAPDRVEIDLHHRALHFGRTGDFDAAMLDRSCPGMLLGRAVRRLTAVDHALQTLVHAFPHDPQPTYGWVVDAVRVLQNPNFDWDDFFREVEHRRICCHMYSVLTYLATAFSLPMPALDRLTASKLFPWEPALHRAEIRAIGQNSQQRGLAGRVAMVAAELLRSRRLNNRVDFQTDYGITMCRSRRSTKPVPVDSGYSATLSRAEGGVLVAVSMAGSLQGRLDFDLWADSRWCSRLRIRSLVFRTRSSCWQAFCRLPSDCAEVLLVHAQSAEIAARLHIISPGEQMGSGMQQE